MEIDQNWSEKQPLKQKNAFYSWERAIILKDAELLYHQMNAL